MPDSRGSRPASAISCVAAIALDSRIEIRTAPVLAINGGRDDLINAGFVKGWATRCGHVRDDLLRIQPLFGFKLIHAGDLGEDHSIGFGERLGKVLLEYGAPCRVRSRLK